MPVSINPIVSHCHIRPYIIRDKHSRTERSTSTRGITDGKDDVTVTPQGESKGIKPNTIISPPKYHITIAGRPDPAIYREGIGHALKVWAIINMDSAAVTIESLPDFTRAIANPGICNPIMVT